jgi:hypothetical protein
MTFTWPLRVIMLKLFTSRCVTPFRALLVVSGRLNGDIDGAFERQWVLSYLLSGHFAGQWRRSFFTRARTCTVPLRKAVSMAW